MERSSGAHAQPSLSESKDILCKESLNMRQGINMFGDICIRMMACGWQWVKELIFMPTWKINGCAWIAFVVLNMGFVCMEHKYPCFH